jgi:hypothetical protein
MLRIHAQNAKTAVVAAGVAAVTAAVMAGAPALAKATSPATAAAASPVIVAGFKNGPVNFTSDSQQVIATMNVPAGSWAISAKETLLNLSAGFVDADCRLVAASASDIARVILEPNGQSASGQTVPFLVIHKFTSPGAVKLTCNGFGDELEATNMKITAIKAGTLTNGPIS